MFILWIVYLFQRNAGIVDLGWCLGIGLCAINQTIIFQGYWIRREILLIMAIIWTGRLFLHMFLRYVKSPEDPRYQKIRAGWSDYQDFRMLGLFLLQAFIAALVSLVFFPPANNITPQLNIWEYTGIIVWFIGVAGESLADQQLDDFRTNPDNKEKVCNIGLWRYSRHPNYFFEWVIWVAFFIFALGSPFGWLTFFSPLLMLYFLVYVTGIAVTEEHSVETKGEAYKEYQANTSMFYPWF
jgi:steroid 5-alpha reductase family enzyme